MNQARSSRSIGSDSSQPVRLSKPVVQVSPYGDYSALGKPSPEWTAKTTDASSCTSSWSEYSGGSSSNNSRGATLRSFRRNSNNNPSFLNRSLDLDSVFEGDEDQDDVSVITEDPSKTALSVDMSEKDELIARLSMQVAELQQKVIDADKKKEKGKGKQPQQRTKQLPSVFLEDEEETTSSDDEEKRKKNIFPQLATVSNQDDLRSKFAKRGKSVRRFSNDSLDKSFESLSSADESLSSPRRRTRKNPQSVEQGSSRLQQAQLDLQKSFSMRGRSSRGLGLSTGGANPSNSSLDSRGSTKSTRRGGRRPAPSPAFQENKSKDSSSESSDSDFENASPTNLRRAFAMSNQVDDSDNDESQSEQLQPENVRRAVAMKGQRVGRLQVGGSCDSIDSTSSYKSTRQRAQIVQDQSSTDSMESMSRGSPTRRMNLTEASRDGIASDMRRATAMKGHSVRNLSRKGHGCRSTDSLEQTNPSVPAEANYESGTSSTEDEDDEPRNLREVWQSAMRKDLGPAPIDDVVDDEESVEESEEQQEAQKRASFDGPGNNLLDMVTEEEEDEEEEEEEDNISESSSDGSSKENSVSAKIEQKASENNLLVAVIEEESVEDSDSSIDTENVFVAAHERAPHQLTPPRRKARAAAALNDPSMLSKIIEDSSSVASSTLAKDQNSASSKDDNDDDILWNPSEFATDEAFEQSNTSFASVSSSNAGDEQLPAREVSKSETTKSLRDSIGILNERTADRNMDKVLTTLEDSFTGVPDDASIESQRRQTSRLAKIAKASFRLGKKRGARPEVVNEDAGASSSKKRGLLKKLIPKKLMSKRGVDKRIHEAGSPIDLALKANSKEVDQSMLAASSAPKSAERQFDSSLLSIGYSNSSASSVFYASVGSLEDVPTSKAPRSSTIIRKIKTVFDVSKSGGEFEDLWKSKVRDGLQFSRHSSSGRADDEPAGDLNWEALNESVQDSFRRPEGALEEIERALDRARSTEFVFELEPDVVPPAQESNEAQKEAVSFNILLEEGGEADRFDSVVEVPRVETKPVALEAGRGKSPPRPLEISPIVRFRRPKKGRLKDTDKEAQQMTLLAL